MDPANSLGDEIQMQSISILFIALIGIGVFARDYTSRIRLLVLLVAVCMVIYITLQ